MKDKAYYIPVLAYHEISPDQWYYNTDAQFEDHIRWLAENGYQAIRLKQYYDYWTGAITEKDLPDKPVLIVFDDGRSGVYNYAFPILKKYNMPFTVFVITGVVGEKDFMTWEQLKEMVASGLCDIGSHTHDLHYFVLEGPNAETWGAAATRIWKDNGIYAYPADRSGTVRPELGPGSPFKSLWGFPIAGTSRNYYTGELFPVESFLGFKADKTFTADRLIMKCPTHIPGETFYDVRVRVSIGRKTGPYSMENEVVVNPSWTPKSEPLDLVNPDLGMTWVVGRYDVIYFDKPYQFEAGKWYNIRLKTLNMSDEQKEMRIFIDPSLPYEEKNCATNSHSTDYNTVGGWAVHHAYPMIILSDGTGEPESIEEYTQRISRDTERVKREIEERIGDCIRKYEVAPLRLNKEITETAIPIFGASKIMIDTVDENGEPKTIERFERIKSYLRVKFDRSFEAKRIKAMIVRHYGRPFQALVNVYIGLWNNGAPTDLSRVRTNFFVPFGWGRIDELDIDFDEDVTYPIEAGKDYCIYFETTNMDYFEEGGEIYPIEGVFRIYGTYDPDGGEISGMWNSRAGDGVASLDGYTRLAVNPYIRLYGEESTYPEGRYVPPVWSIAFPFGAYTDKLNELQEDHEMKMQFTIFNSVFDNRENHNMATVNDLKQIPRVMMTQFMPSFPTVVKLNTFELFLPPKAAPDVTVYGYVINRPWGCRSLREHWREIDVAVFDAYNFDRSLNVTGEPNPDWTWFKSLGKPVYVMFGNYGPNGWDTEAARAVFDNPQQSIDAIDRIVESEGWDGIAIDFEEVKPSDRSKATAWFRALAERFHQSTRYIPIFVAAPYPFARNPEWSEWFDYAEIGKVVDIISPMTYLDHGSWTEPGPISDMNLFKKRYMEILKHVPARKIAGGLGVFGCIWNGDIAAEKNLIEIKSQMNTRFEPEKDFDADEWKARLEGGGVAWFQAPDTFYNRMAWLYEQGIRSVAIWKLDDDDFTWWKYGFHSLAFRPKYRTEQII